MGGSSKSPQCAIALGSFPLPLVGITSVLSARQMLGRRDLVAWGTLSLGSRWQAATAFLRLQATCLQAEASWLSALEADRPALLCSVWSQEHSWTYQNWPPITQTHICLDTGSLSLTVDFAQKAIVPHWNCCPLFPPTHSDMSGPGPTPGPSSVVNQMLNCSWGPCYHYSRF